MLSIFISSGLSPPIHFNKNVNVFIPKGENEDDAVEVIREATETRPLGLKSTDNKIIGAVWNICAKTLSRPPLAESSAASLLAGR